MKDVNHLPAEGLLPRTLPGRLEKRRHAGPSVLCAPGTSLSLTRLVPEVHDEVEVARG